MFKVSCCQRGGMDGGYGRDKRIHLVDGPAGSLAGGDNSPVSGDACHVEGQNTAAIKLVFQSLNGRP